LRNIVTGGAEDLRRNEGSRIPPEEEERIKARLFDRHYRSLLDQAVPVLGDISPRASRLRTLRLHLDVAGTEGASG